MFTKQKINLDKFRLQLWVKKLARKTNLMVFAFIIEKMFLSANAKVIHLPNEHLCSQLSDLLLLCTPRLIGGRVISGPQYRLRARYKVENLEVLEGDNLETANTFYIRDSNKTVELYTQ